MMNGHLQHSSFIVHHSSFMILPDSLWNAEAILALGRPWPPQSVDEAMKVIEQTAHDSLFPLFATQGPRDANVDAALARCKAMLRVFEHRARRFAAAAGHVAQVLDGEPFLFAKGIDYAFRLYGDPALRPMKDIDVIVPLARVRAVHERLRAAGFPHQPVAGMAGRTDRFHETGYVVDTDIFVDVHHSFVQRSRYTVDYEAVFAEAVPLEGATFRARRLGDLHALAYHVINIAKDELSVPLARYVDLWLMLASDESLLPRLVELAPRWQMRRALYATLRMLTTVMPETATPAVREALASSLPKRTREFLDARVLPDPLGEQGGIHVRGRRVQLWRKLWLLDNWRRRALFLGDHARMLAAGALAGRNAFDEHEAIRNASKP
jgi:hypothetical protein